jgi:outer membrane lipoprotein-sorting protein
MTKRIISRISTKKKNLSVFIFCIIMIATMSTGEALDTDNLDAKDKAIQNYSSTYEQKRKEKIEMDAAIYKEYGLTYDKDNDMFYYNGEGVKSFFDKLNTN